MLTDLRDSRSVAVQGIHLNWRGEPLMNPPFSQLLATVAEVMPNVKLQWRTNGTMLTEKRMRDILSVDFPHTIFVSLDGGNKYSHDLNRGEGNFDKTLAGLERLLDQAANRPELTIGDVDDLQSDHTLGRMLSEEVLPHLPVLQLPCFWAGHVFCVDPTGDVAICVIGHGRAGVVGNLLRDGVDRVLAGALAFRCNLADHGRGAVGHCKDCRKPAGRISRSTFTRRAWPHESLGEVNA